MQHGTATTSGTEGRTPVSEVLARIFGRIRRNHSFVYTWMWDGKGPEKIPAYSKTCHLWSSVAPKEMKTGRGRYTIFFFNFSITSTFIFMYHMFCYFNFISSAYRNGIRFEFTENINSNLKQMDIKFEKFSSPSVRINLQMRLHPRP